MPDVIFSRRALQTIRRIDEFLSEHNPEAARRVLAEIQRTAKLLGEFPMIGVATGHGRRAARTPGGRPGGGRT